MTIKILILTLLISSSVLTNARNCQCQCCQYMGRLSSNNNKVCPCTVTNQGKPFACGGSTGIYSARVCTTKSRAFYMPNSPNLCCQLKFV